jgi:hypothetical protein
MNNPKQRLGSNGSEDTIRTHLFFRGIDWQALHDKRVKPPEVEKVPENTEEDIQFWKGAEGRKITRHYQPNLFQGFSFINYRTKPTNTIQQQVSEV